MRGLVLAAILALSSCRGQDPSPAPAAAPEDAALQKSAAPAEAARPPPIPKLQVVVGGCRADCADGALAAQRFLDATASGDPTEVALFLDATRLVLDGQALGDEWARAFREGRTAARRDGIDAAARELAAWARGLPADQVRQVLTAGPRVVKRWSTETVVELPVPGGAPWTVTLRPRGLEWLIVEVRRTPSAPAGPH